MIINQFLKTKQNRRASVVYKHIHCCLVFCIFEERLIDRFIFWTLEAGDELQKMVIPVIYVYVILFPFFLYVRYATWNWDGFRCMTKKSKGWFYLQAGFGKKRLLHVNVLLLLLSVLLCQEFFLDETVVVVD